MSVWGVRGPVQFALPGPNSKREDGYSPQPELQRNECDVGLGDFEFAFAFSKSSTRSRGACLRIRLTLRALPAGRAFITTSTRL